MAVAMRALLFVSVLVAWGEFRVVKAQATCTARTNTDLAAGTATNIDALPDGIAVSSAGECCEVCAAYPQCIAGVFNTETNAWCWPVKSFSGYEAHGGRTVVEKLAPAATTTTTVTTTQPAATSSAGSCTVRTNTDLRIGTATNIDALPDGIAVYSLAQCCEVCAAYPQCIAGVFNTETNAWCWPVKSFSGYEAHGGRTVVEKQESPATEPPVTEPPVTEPPVTEPPVTEPPVTEPPVPAACNGARADAACCTASSPCALHEGDCDNDGECAGNLVCGVDNCNSLGLGFPNETWDCCVPPAQTGPKNLVATLSRLRDGVFCLCEDSLRQVVSPNDLPVTLEICDDDYELEIISFNSDTNVAVVDGEGGYTVIDLSEDYYLYTDEGQCVLYIGLSIEDQDPHDYDEDVAFSMIRYADAADEDAHIQNIMVPLGFENSTLHEAYVPVLGSEVHAFVSVHHGLQRVVISARGNEDVTQFVEQLADIFLDSTDLCQNCEVLEYFDDASVGLLDNGIRSRVVSLTSAYPNYELWFTGHSMGGSVASLMALRLRLEGIVPASVLVYVVGSPRVGEQNFVEFYDQMVPNTFRIVYHRDIVVSLPTCNLSGCENSGPNHYGTEVWYIEDLNVNDALCGKRICAESESEDCARSLTFGLSITDHREGYFKILEDNRGFCGRGAPAGESLPS